MCHTILKPEVSQSCEWKTSVNIIVDMALEEQLILFPEETMMDTIGVKNVSKRNDNEHIWFIWHLFIPLKISLIRS